MKEGDHAGWQEAGIVQEGRIKNDFMFMLKAGQGEKYTKYKRPNNNNSSFRKPNLKNTIKDKC